MTSPDVKLLKKLADACRKAGIRSFKCPEFEFELTDEAPTPQTRRNAAKGQPQAANSGPDKPFETDSLTPEQLLAWSLNDVAGEPPTGT